jgi:hypothetical protein
MPDDAHNVRLLSLLVNRVTHGFTVNGETLVLFPKHCIPFLERGIEFNRVNPDQNVADDRFTGYAIAAPFLPATTKAFSGFRAQIIRLAGHGFVTAHTA